MEQEHRRIKRAAVSGETRHGRRRAAVNPNARRPGDPDAELDMDVEDVESAQTDGTGRTRRHRSNRGGGQA